MTDTTHEATSFTDAYSYLAIERITPRYWRVAFDHGPINTLTADMVAELALLVDAIEHDPDLNVVVFTSRNPEFFLAHYDTEGDPAKTVSMPPGPTGMHPWLDLTVRLSRAPVVSIASVRGRARGIGSEFVLACDIRPGGDKAILGQFEVGTGAVPGGGALARLPRLVGRGRALEILLVGDDIDAARAERYGYVNRVVPDAELERETDRVARRLASFDKQAIAEIKAFVDATTLPGDEELPGGLSAFFASSARPATQARVARRPRTASEATPSWSGDWASWSRSQRRNRNPDPATVAATEKRGRRLPAPPSVWSPPAIPPLTPRSLPPGPVSRPESTRSSWPRSP